jgi:hypothetical protein
MNLAGLWRSKIVRRGFGGTLAASVLVTGLIGVAHTPAGRPLLAFLPGASVACPVPAEIRNLTPAQRDANHRRAVQTLKGSDTAVSRPGIAIRLGATRDELASWASTNGAQCDEQRSGLEVRCTNVPAISMGVGEQGSVRVDALTFGFDVDGHLVSTLAMESTSSANAAAEAVRDRASELARQAGPVTSHVGETTPEYLASGALRQARAEFKFSDYHASVAATNMGHDRYVISEVRELIR